MKVAVIGRGSSGNRYCGYLEEMGVDHIQVGSNDEGWIEIDEFMPNAVLICNTTEKHVLTAVRAVGRDLPFLMEKPIGCEDTNELDLLNIEIERKGIFSMVGYQFRYHPEIQNLRGKLIGRNQEIRIVCHTNIEKWGKEYSCRRETGGGALTELSHEIDLAEFLCGSVVEIHGALSAHGEYCIDAENKADVFTTHENGQKVWIILDLLSDVEERYVHFKSHLKDMTIHYSVTDDAYRAQLSCFLSQVNALFMPWCCGQTVPAQAPLFKKWIGLRDA